MGRRRIMKEIRSSTAPCGAKSKALLRSKSARSRKMAAVSKLEARALLSVPAYQMALSVLTQCASAHHAHHKESARCIQAESKASARGLAAVSTTAKNDVESD